MGFQPYGQLPEPVGYKKPHESVKDELIFEDGSSAHSAGFKTGVQGWIIRSDGTAEFQGIVILGDGTILGADLYSDNWDGAIPANLVTVDDPTATVGYYLDHSAGAAQFMGNVYVGGDIFLESGRVKTGSTGDIVDMGGPAPSAELRFLNVEDAKTHALVSSYPVQAFGATYKRSVAGINVYHLNNNGDGASFIIAGTNDGSDEHVAFSFIEAQSGSTVDFFDWLAKFEKTKSTTPWLQLEQGGSTSEFEILSGGLVNIVDGSAAAPALAFISDPDTGFMRSGSGDVDFVANATARMRLKGKGLFTDYSNNSLPRVWIAEYASHTFSSAATWETVGTDFSVAVGVVDPVSVIATVTGMFRNSASTTLREARVRVRISVDGGSTWAFTSATVRADGLASNGNVRIPCAANGGLENATPTGNVVVRVDVQADHTEVVVDSLTLNVTIVGDI